MDDAAHRRQRLAGLLRRSSARERDGVPRTCQSCGAERPLAAHRAYLGAGVSCAARPAATSPCASASATRLAVEWRGTLTVPRQP